MCESVGKKKCKNNINFGCECVRFDRIIITIIMKLLQFKIVFKEIVQFCILFKWQLIFW